MPLTDRIRHFLFSCPNWWIGMLGCIFLEPQLIICNPVEIPVRLSILLNSNLHSVESSYIISMRFVFQMANFTKRFDVWSCSLGMQFSFLIRKIRKLLLIICIYAIHMPKIKSLHLQWLALNPFRGIMSNSTGPGVQATTHFVRNCSTEEPEELHGVKMPQSKHLSRNSGEKCVHIIYKYMTYANKHCMHA